MKMKQKAFNYIKATNIKWVVNINEALDMLKEMNDKEISKTLYISLSKLNKMSDEDKRDFAYSLFRHCPAILEEFMGLPNEVQIPDSLIDTIDDVYDEAEEISDWLSNEFGFCHEGFELVLGNFEMLVESEKLSDSMCLDSGTRICEYKEGKDKVEIEVRGYVTVDFKGETFRHYSDMPEELQDMFKNGSAYDDKSVVIHENNWYEVFFNHDQNYDVAEVEEYTPTELKNFCRECMVLFRFDEDERVLNSSKTETNSNQK